MPEPRPSRRSGAADEAAHGDGAAGSGGAARDARRAADAIAPARARSRAARRRRRLPRAPGRRAAGLLAADDPRGAIPRARRATHLPRRPRPAGPCLAPGSYAERDNSASRADPAGGSRKLPHAPANPRSARVGKPCSSPGPFRRAQPCKTRVVEQAWFVRKVRDLRSGAVPVLSRKSAFSTTRATSGVTGREGGGQQRSREVGMACSGGLDESGSPVVVSSGLRHLTGT